MIKMILSGCNGKMGQAIARLAAETDDVEIVCGIDLQDMGLYDFPIYSLPPAYTGQADVIVDFSHPSAFEKLTEFALERKIPLVMATTGLDESQRERLKELSKTIPVFFSANMSLGVNLLIDLVKKAANVLYGSFDIEIIERHHNQKVDAPSGTALAIADAIDSVLEDEMEYVYDRHCVRKKRGKQEIGIHALRGGTIVGQHNVVFAGTDEVIELSHTATSKEVFAVGSIRAARFLQGKTPGMYSMADLVASM